MAAMLMDAAQSGNPRQCIAIYSRGRQIGKADDGSAEQVRGSDYKCSGVMDDTVKFVDRPTSRCQWDGENQQSAVMVKDEERQVQEPPSSKRGAEEESVWSLMIVQGFNAAKSLRYQLALRKHRGGWEVERAANLERRVWRCQGFKVQCWIKLNA